MFSGEEAFWELHLAGDRRGLWFSDVFSRAVPRGRGTVLLDAHSPQAPSGALWGRGAEMLPKGTSCELLQTGGGSGSWRGAHPCSILGPPLSRPHPPVALFLLLRNIPAPCLSTSTMLRYLGVWETRQPGAAGVEAPKGELPSALGGLQIQPLQAPRRWSTGLEDRNCAMNSHLSHTDSWKQD